MFVGLLTKSRLVIVLSQEHENKILLINTNVLISTLHLI